MKRLGKYSGRIYSEDEKWEIEECSLIITDEQSEDEKYILEKREENLKDCRGCFGCPISAYWEWRGWKNDKERSTKT